MQIPERFFFFARESTTEKQFRDPFFHPSLFLRSLPLATDSRNEFYCERRLCRMHQQVSRETPGARNRITFPVARRYLFAYFRIRSPNNIVAFVMFFLRMCAQDKVRVSLRETPSLERERERDDGGDIYRAIIIIIIYYLVRKNYLALLQFIKS